MPVYHIFDKPSDTQGYVGYNSNQSTIYVVFRGSVSLENWMSDLDSITTKYPPCSNCHVHKGFFDTEQKIINETISQVAQLKTQFPLFDILVTGHSLGKYLVYSLSFYIHFTFIHGSKFNPNLIPNPTRSQMYRRCFGNPCRCRCPDGGIGGCETLHLWFPTRRRR